MEKQKKTESPATFMEAINHGRKAGLELNEARKEMRELIAHKLQSLRLEQKLTQQELAIKVDINHLTYRGYENCKSDIPIVYLIRLADVFEVSLDYLTGRTENRTNCKLESKTRQIDTDARLEELEKKLQMLIDTQNKNS